MRECAEGRPLGLAEGPTDGYVLYPACRQGISDPLLLRDNLSATLSATHECVRMDEIAQRFGISSPVLLAQRNSRNKRIWTLFRVGISSPNFTFLPGTFSPRNCGILERGTLLDPEPRVDRRGFLAAATTGLLGLADIAAMGEIGAAPMAPPSGGEPLNVNDRKQLFIDRLFIASAENITLTMNPAQKLGIVLDSTNEPWELGTGGFFRVIDDGGKFKMYYGAFTEAGKSLCYA